MKKLMVFCFFFFCFFILANPICAFAGNRAVFLTPSDNDQLLPGTNFAVIANPSACNITDYALVVRYDDGFSDWAEISYSGINFGQAVAIPFTLETGHGLPVLFFLYRNECFLMEDIIYQEFGIFSGNENSQLIENLSDQFPFKTIVSVIRPRKPIYANS